jgi:Tol biopolymer transport system component
MLAWSPVGNSLAYVTPVNEKWGWFVGDLVIEDMTSQKAVYTSQDIEVAGDLTWSPDGSQLAFVVLDPKVKVYTVDVLDLSSGKVQDAFGNSAATDQWSAPKGIDKWSDSHTLLMNASCDVDCSRLYTYDTQSGQLTFDTTSDTRKADDHSLDLVNQPSSPNSRWQIVSDNNNNVWTSSTVNHQASVILTGTTINEIKWSGDSSYLALRTDDSVLIYQPVCSK